MSRDMSTGAISSSTDSEGEEFCDKGGFKVNLEKGFKKEGPSVTIGKRLQFFTHSEDETKSRVLKNATSLANQLRAKSRADLIAKKRSLIPTQPTKASPSVQMNVELVPSLSQMKVYNTLLNMNTHLRSKCFAQRHSGLLAFESLFPSSPDDCIPVSRMALEAGLLEPLTTILQCNFLEIDDEEFGCHAKESIKISIKILTKLSYGCRKSLKVIKQRKVHLQLVGLLKQSMDMETLGLVALALGHLVADDSEMRADVMSAGCVERLSSYVESLGSETELKSRILFFMQSCFNGSPNLKKILPAVRTFVSIIQEWRDLSIECLRKILSCLSTVLGQNKDLLMSLADNIWQPLIEIYKEHGIFEVRTLAVCALGDVCALDKNIYCIKVLEQGLCDQIGQLALQCQLTEPDQEELSTLLRYSIFLLSNVVADKCPQVLTHLMQSQIYQQVLIPLFKWQQCPSDLRTELAYCIGNVFICADFSQIKQFIEIGFLELLVSALSSHQSDVLVRVAMTAIRKLFRKTRKYQKIANEFGLNDCSIIFAEFERLGGLDTLESLLSHRCHDIYEHVLYLLETYFEIDYAATTGLQDSELLRLFI